MKHKVTDFLAQIRTLQSLSDSLSFLENSAQKNNREEDFLNLTQASSAIQSANQNLIKSIQFGLFSAQENASSSFSLVEKNIIAALKNIQNTSEISAPHKEELLSLISSFIPTFAEKEIISLFKILKENEDEFSKQIILLEDLCEDF